MALRIRPARPGDASTIAAIYNEGIAERRATFETRPRTGEEMAEAVAAAARPFLVAVDGDVLGWARLSEYSDRDCYAGVAEASIYVAASGRGRGIGRALLDALLAAAASGGHWKVVALLFGENAASVGLFRAAGFRDVGVLRRHARLDGEWRDVVLVERGIDEGATAPPARGA